MGAREWSRCNVFGQRMEEVPEAPGVFGCAHVLLGIGTMALPAASNWARPMAFDTFRNGVVYPTLGLFFVGRRSDVEQEQAPMQPRDAAWFSRAIGRALHRYVIAGYTEHGYEDAVLMSLQPQEIANGYVNARAEDAFEAKRLRRELNDGEPMNTVIYTDIAASLIVGPGDKEGLQLKLIGGEDAYVMGVHRA